MDNLGRIGLVAVHREGRPLRDVLRDPERERLGEAILYTGWIGRQPVVLADVLPGPVNAALGAQALVLGTGVRALISAGSAGTLDSSLSPGDVIIVQRAVAHDAGVFLGRRFEPAGVMGRDELGRVGHRRAFVADPKLVALALTAARSLGLEAHVGTVVTGNQAVFSTTRKRWLQQAFDALAVEMETAAVAQVAVAHGLPWGAIRAISDTADDNLTLDYSRLNVYLDGDQPLWRTQVSRWVYLLVHPAAWRRLRRLRRGLAAAAEGAASVVETMLCL